MNMMTGQEKEGGRRSAHKSADSCTSSAAWKNPSFCHCSSPPAAAMAPNHHHNNNHRSNQEPHTSRPLASQPQPRGWLGFHRKRGSISHAGKPEEEEGSRPTNARRIEEEAVQGKKETRGGVFLGFRLPPPPPLPSARLASPPVASRRGREET